MTQTSYKLSRKEKDNKKLSEMEKKNDFKTELECRFKIEKLRNKTVLKIKVQIYLLKTFKQTSLSNFRNTH